ASAAWCRVRHRTSAGIESASRSSATIGASQAGGSSTTIGYLGLAASWLPAEAAILDLNAHFAERVDRLGGSPQVAPLDGEFKGREPKDGLFGFRPALGCQWHASALPSPSQAKGVVGERQETRIPRRNMGKRKN